MPRITDMISPDMIEATRLTREGQLAQATALLQRFLRGKAPATPAGPAPHPAPGARSSGSSSRLLEVDPETGVAREADPGSPARQARRPDIDARSAGRSRGPVEPAPRPLDGLLGKLKQAGLTGQHPAPTPAPVPEGAQFLAATRWTHRT